MAARAGDALRTVEIFTMSQSIRSDRISESTVARMAGNIACGIAGTLMQMAGGVSNSNELLALIAGESKRIAETSVAIARAVVTETARTAPPGDSHDGA